MARYLKFCFVIHLQDGDNTLLADAGVAPSNEGNKN